MPDPPAAAGRAGPPVSAEDAKLVTLARAARARIGAPEGAAVRDPDGRTYAAGTVALPNLRLGALEAAVVVAVGSGADALDAAAVVGTDEPSGAAVLADLSCPLLVVADPTGAVREVRAVPDSGVPAGGGPGT